MLHDLYIYSSYLGVNQDDDITQTNYLGSITDDRGRFVLRHSISSCPYHSTEKCGHSSSEAEEGDTILTGK